MYVWIIISEKLKHAYIYYRYKLQVAGGAAFLCNFIISCNFVIVHQNYFEIDTCWARICVRCNTLQQSGRNRQGMTYNGSGYEYANRYGHMTWECLHVTVGHAPFISSHGVGYLTWSQGKQWNDISLCFIHSSRPTTTGNLKRRCCATV